MNNADNSNFQYNILYLSKILFYIRDNVFMKFDYFSKGLNEEFLNPVNIFCYQKNSLHIFLIHNPNSIKFNQINFLIKRIVSKAGQVNDFV